MIFVNSIDETIEIVKYLWLRLFKYIKILKQFLKIIWTFFVNLTTESKA